MLWVFPLFLFLNEIWGTFVQWKLFFSGLFDTYFLVLELGINFYVANLLRFEVDTKNVSFSVVRCCETRWGSYLGIFWRIGQKKGHWGSQSPWLSPWCFWSSIWGPGWCVLSRSHEWASMHFSTDLFDNARKIFAWIAEQISIIAQGSVSAVVGCESFHELLENKVGLFD